MSTDHPQSRLPVGHRPDGAAAERAAGRRAALARELGVFLNRYTVNGADKLLEAHRDDGTGHCRVCSAGGQTGRSTWPCQLYAAAHAVSRGPAARGAVVLRGVSSR